MKKIKKIMKVKNGVVHNDHHDKDYVVKDGIILVQYEDDSTSILDAEGHADITESDYLSVKLDNAVATIIFENKALF